ncbi:plasmid mobilization protein [Amorphus sp. MBR-141]
MGRRALAAEARQAAILDVRLPGSQRAFIAECAERGGTSVADYVRGVLAGVRRRPYRRRFERLKTDAKIRVRMTVAELDRLRSLARERGMSLGRYVRLVLSGARPRGRSAAPQALKQVVYELQSMGANFRQLAAGLGDPDYLEWRTHVAVILVRDCVRAVDQAEAMGELLGTINYAGHLLNWLAYRANAGHAVTEVEEADVLEAVAAALKPLEDCVWAAEAASGR